MKRTLMLGYLLIFLTCCMGMQANPRIFEIATENEDSVVAKARGKLATDSVTLADFEVTIQLSAAAEKKLRQQKEPIIVTAYYSGVPKDINNKEYREEGNYTFHTYSIELTNNRTAKFNGVKVSKKMYATLANRDIDVLINVYSGRRSTPDNLLDVDILSEKLAEVEGKSYALKGKLIGE